MKMSLQIAEAPNMASGMRPLSDAELNDVNGAMILEAFFCVTVGVTLGILWMIGEGSMRGGNVDMGEWLDSMPPIL
jgi:hypothetical protein